MELQKSLDYVEKNIQEIIDLTIEICKIPSPTGNEQQKALFIKDKLLEYGANDANIDQAGNVLYLHKNYLSDRRKITLITAHIDTVFHNTENIEPIVKEGKIFAPSAGDNSVNVAALIFIIKMLNELEISFKKDILFAFDVGEEGLGNLKGIKAVFDNWEDDISEVIALDLAYDNVVNNAVGSKRYMVSVNTEGGHSWGSFGNDNAIFYSSSIIKDLYDIDVPKKPKTTYNVGVIKGGTSVNTIAAYTEFLVDMRSEDKEQLKELDNKFLSIANRYLEEYKGRVAINLQIIGERPCGIKIEARKTKCNTEDSLEFNAEHDSEFNAEHNSECNLEYNSMEERLIRVRGKLNFPVNFVSASTDANIPLSKGIPALSFGVCRGGNSHRLDEYIELDSLDRGMKHLIHFLFDE
ncbi:MAG TPA: M20/M25/M40 family metallo-hydrolase [Clostridiales bacterium]|mgnify:CR=1 FL=1|nr:M20/M25/M40 family metallo-hydrolase [Clostridiales bacterium]